MCGLADMYYSSPDTLVPNYETTRHIKKKKKTVTLGLSIFWVLAIRLMGIIELFSVSTSKHFNFSV